QSLRGARAPGRAEGRALYRLDAGDGNRGPARPGRFGDDRPRTDRDRARPVGGRHLGTRGWQNGRRPYSAATDAAPLRHHGPTPRVGRRDGLAVDADRSPPGSVDVFPTAPPGVPVRLL